MGTIGEALVRGLVSAHGPQLEVVLSPRNAERARELADRFDDVEVLSSNQAVLDRSDWVVLAVIPRLAQQIISELRFRPEQRVVSLVADFDLTRLRALVGPTALLARMVPLPFVAERIGPLTAYPVTAEVEAVFGPLGDLVAARDEAALDLLMTITSLMSPYYAVIGQVVAWGVRQGLPADLTARFTLSLFQAWLAQGRRLEPAALVEHWREMTPGGLNQLAMEVLEQGDAIGRWSQAMDQILARIRPPAD
ncbi:MAG: NAD(P)-binding domain-containing protein [Propionibacteriaceae bacterium]|nr:NAD(P)-binding domain-containing protein [Propionibacteriaceae bacterium]